MSSELCLYSPTLANATKSNGTNLSLSIILPQQNHGIVAPAANLRLFVVLDDRSVTV